MWLNFIIYWVSIGIQCTVYAKFNCFRAFIFPNYLSANLLDLFLYCFHFKLILKCFQLNETNYKCLKNSPSIADILQLIIIRMIYVSQVIVITTGLQDLNLNITRLYIKYQILVQPSGLIFFNSSVFRDLGSFKIELRDFCKFKSFTSSFLISRQNLVILDRI